MAEFWEVTVGVVQPLIRRPKLTEALLRKPPFRFLHDVVTEVIKATGFGQGLFDEIESDSANIKDKDTKVSYLTKIIDCVGIAVSTYVPARPLKIVAGLEPEHTNTFLQLLARAATECSPEASAAAVRRVLAGEHQQAQQQPTQPPPQPPPQQQPQPQQSQQQAAPPSARPKEAPSSSSKQDKAEAPSPVLSTPSPASTRQSSRASSRGGDQPQQAQPSGRSESGLGAAESREGGAEARGEAKTSRRQRASRPDEADVPPLPPRAEARPEPTPTGGDDAFGESAAVTQRPPMPPMPQRPQSARKAPPKPKGERPGSALRPVAEARPGTGKPSVLKPQIVAEGEPEKDDEDDSDMAEPILIAEQPLGRETLEVTAEGAGKLVRDILETKKDLEQRDEDGDLRKGPKDPMSRNREEVEALRASIQTLARAASVLVQCASRAPEDADAAAREAQAWNAEARVSAERWREERRLTEEEMARSAGALAQVEEEIKKQQTRVNAAKAQVLRNDETIRKLLQMVVAEAGR